MEGVRVNGLSDEALYVVLSKMLARRAISPKLRRRLAPVYVLMLGLGMFSVVQRSVLVMVAGLSIGVAAMLGVWIAFLYTLSGERRLDAAVRVLRARNGGEALSGLGLSAVDGTGIYPQMALVAVLIMPLMMGVGVVVVLMGLEIIALDLVFFRLLSVLAVPVCSLLVWLSVLAIRALRAR